MKTVYLALAPWSPLLLPVIFPAIGYVVAYILRQEHWRPVWKDLVAWIILVISAVADIIASDRWSNNPNLMFPAISGVLTLLMAGAYAQLTPWLAGMTWIERTLFNLPSAAKVPANKTPTLAQPVEEQPTTPVPTISSQKVSVNLPENGG